MVAACVVVVVEQLLREHVVAVLPSTLWKTITPDLYIVFWTFSLRDVFLPKDEYTKHINRLKAEITSQETAMRVANDAGDKPVDAKDKKDWEKKKKTLTETIKKLTDEQPLQTAHTKKVRANPSLGVTVGSVVGATLIVGTGC